MKKNILGIILLVLILVASSEVFAQRLKSTPGNWVGRTNGFVLAQENVPLCGGSACVPSVLTGMLVDQGIVKINNMDDAIEVATYLANKLGTQGSIMDIVDTLITTLTDFSQGVIDWFNGMYLGIETSSKGNGLPRMSGQEVIGGFTYKWSEYSSRPLLSDLVYSINNGGEVMVKTVANECAPERVVSVIGYRKDGTDRIKLVAITDSLVGSSGLRGLAIAVGRGDDEFLDLDYMSCRQTVTQIFTIKGFNRRQ